jgi:hypothetical protein
MHQSWLQQPCYSKSKVIAIQVSQAPSTAGMLNAANHCWHCSATAARVRTLQDSRFSQSARDTILQDKDLTGFQVQPICKGTASSCSSSHHAAATVSVAPMQAYSWLVQPPDALLAWTKHKKCRPTQCKLLLLLLLRLLSLASCLAHCECCLDQVATRQHTNQLALGINNWQPVNLLGQQQPASTMYNMW